MNELDVTKKKVSSLYSVETLLVDLHNKGMQTTGLTIGGRKGGAGPTDDRAFILNGKPVMIPVLNEPAKHSPYSLVQESSTLSLKHEELRSPIATFLEAVKRPKFYDLTTKDGIPYNKIAVLHGADVLASTVIQTCIRWSKEKRCQFCAIGQSLESGNTIARKKPKQLAEVVKAAEKLDHIKHITLTTGTPNETDRGALYLAECVKAIREVSDLPIQVQCEPPEDDTLYQVLKDAGANTIGLHVESFDEDVRRKVMPSKSEITLETYFKAFKKAVSVFGRNQVSTYVIIGLGEDLEKTIDGCEKAAKLGVYPFVVPLRPLQGTMLEFAEPPSSELMTTIYGRVSNILETENLSSTKSEAGCAKCGACSALPFFEKVIDKEGIDYAEELRN
ncbi:MSMEG_0568 family radical SAM protein [Halalkalibacter nanhaiisediminis]|uniref:Radical SAM protein (TIGR04043 family) n=1 Tax=Halalkalibacter nanhaiisediminis TaxID=688079 RepID=A0A562QQX4_9BACI|nr:MSMEG_0568 family radical SAM protein [Halalkalibacter nanhaiisediminis]TWI59105.1 radical SAM protein (TIGR04043 family) [Halalkalibacter nanhaiisediminis]